MIKATTSSRAVYLIDIENKMFCRLATHPLETHVGGMHIHGFKKYVNMPEIITGPRLVFELGGDDYVISSEVTKIEDVENPVLDSWL